MGLNDLATLKVIHCDLTTKDGDLMDITTMNPFYDSYIYSSKLRVLISVYNQLYQLFLTIAPRLCGYKTNSFIRRYIMAMMKDIARQCPRRVIIVGLCSPVHMHGFLPET